MSPTSRNTLMVGGALILVALLLVCGPLSGQFGSGGPSVDETPDVAAGPPAEGVGALGAAAVGALAGATLGEAGVDQVVATRMSDSDCAEMRREIREGTRDPQDALDSDCPPLIGGGSEGAVAGATAAGGEPVAGSASGAVANAGTVAGNAAAGAATAVSGATSAAASVAASGAAGAGAVGAAGAAGSTAAVGGAGTRGISAVGAASTTAANTVSGLSDAGSSLAGAGAAAGVAAAADAVGSFDNAFAALSNGNGGVGTAGPVVNRFPPPVAAPAPGGFQVASSLNAGALIRPCDTPGSGCRNVSGVAGNPPIIPGGPPVVTNPPIVPGGPPNFSTGGGSNDI